MLLEKEIEIMKNYIDLEKERYGNKIEISWDVEGDIKINIYAHCYYFLFWKMHLNMAHLSNWKSPG